MIQLIQKPDIDLSQWEQLGWEFAFLTTCLSSAVTTIFFVMNRFEMGPFPLWFFIRWAGVERLLNQIFSVLWIVLMVAALFADISDPAWELLILVGYTGSTALAGYLQRRIMPRLEALEESKF